MNFIVLVKQVPDISNIPEEAWDRERGTLKRGVLDSVLNPLDLHALTLACRMREAFGRGGGKVACLTMGPPQAKDVLADSLARGADEAVLLTDRAFSGADTVATGYSLAMAIRKIEKEIFKSSDFIIVAGMQSVDGDTAQVPAQIAEELGIEQISYAQTFSFDGELAVKRIGPGGMETVVPKVYPVLITATASTQTLYRSFHRARKARRHPVIEWDAKAVGAAPDRVGLKGSRTQVYRIFSPSEERHKECVYPKTPEELADLLEKKYKAAPSAQAEEAKAGYSLSGKTPSYRGEVWIYAEQEQGILKPVSLEILGTARELADVLHEKAAAVLVGSGVEHLAKELIAHGADKVYLAEHPLLEHFLPLPYKKTISDLVVQYAPQIMLFGATPLGRELAPRVAYSSDSGLTADCTRLEIDDFQKGPLSLTAILKQTRPALGGNIMATIMTKDSRTQMATVRPGVLKARKRDPSRTGEIIRAAPELSEGMTRTEIVATESLPARTKISDADIIVSGGRGLGSKANYDKTIRPLAEALKSFLPGRIEVGASRMAVEEGFIHHDHQVGQTGQTVQPKLYIAVAISGAVQHISGMQNSEIIVAVNKDPHARIFNYADFGIVGDWETVIPRLTEAVQKRKVS